MSQREDLLAGAKKCLVDKGYSRTTARDIAAASGAHLASIGYHFGSKDNLMNTAVIEASSEWGDLFEAGVRAAGRRTPRERVHDLLESLFRTMPDQMPVLVAGTQALAQVPFDADVREKMTAAHEQARVSMAALVLGVPEGDVDAATAAGLGSVTYALVTGYVMQAVVDPDSLPAPDQAAAGIMALAGTAAPEGSTSP
ncbi:TetR family transcriptional regulator [Nocardiopsis sp. Huas11]|uniref:TetR/AcrR family transcriptional regulator n=1 Tax=Nocardiopsis sp. Huas11 TaxID=2183912 RepID=UPI000EB1FB00|nr:TetR/AcrR family transcriptional regulator [Nocardiopsis sp. Huas11]RKS05492.1 TetR family transcriptional regulator [Nocardiopsis sp. Huas11]